MYAIQAAIKTFITAGLFMQCTLKRPLGLCTLVALAGLVPLTAPMAAPGELDTPALTKLAQKSGSIRTTRGTTETTAEFNTRMAALEKAFSALVPVNPSDFSGEWKYDADLEVLKVSQHLSGANAQDEFWWFDRRERERARQAARDACLPSEPPNVPVVVIWRSGFREGNFEGSTVMGVRASVRTVASQGVGLAILNSVSAPWGSVEVTVPRERLKAFVAQLAWRYSGTLASVVEPHGGIGSWVIERTRNTPATIDFAVQSDFRLLLLPAMVEKVALINRRTGEVLGELTTPTHRLSLEGCVPVNK